MNNKKSRILTEVYNTAEGLHNIGVFSKVNMHSYDKLCIELVHELSALEIKRLRERAKVSQAVFAIILNTSVSTIQKWEIGEKKPSNLALKLLNLIERKGIEVVL
jgi:putative transcriptional regulator